MRGSDAEADGLFSYVDLEARVPKHHPLRAIRQLVPSYSGLSAAASPLRR